MHDPLRFRRDLATRILGLLGAASLTAAPAACTSGGAKGTSGTATVTTSVTQSTTTTTTTMIVDAGTGGVGGAGGANAGGGGMGGGLGNPPATACFDWPFDAGADAANDPDAGPAPGGCPTDPKVVLADFLALACPEGWEPYKIVSGPTTNATQQCCYLVYDILCGPGGRPYFVGGHPGGRPRASPERRALIAAPLRGADARGWGAGHDGGSRPQTPGHDGGSRPQTPGHDGGSRPQTPGAEGPRLDSLGAVERASLAEAWGADALLEHASVASFARFSLALLAAGAPADLVELSHRAALDEVEHARLCFALASAYAGETIAPGPFPLGGEVQVGAGLAALAASAVEEGCVGETVAAVVASAQLAQATDPAVRAALAQIAADEARHAELAWRTVAWAVQTGGGEVRAAVEQALAAALRRGAAAASAETAAPTALSAHGRLDAATTAMVAASALAEIVAPAAFTLLQRDVGSRPTSARVERSSAASAGH